MIAVAEALDIVLGHSFPLAIEETPLDPPPLGRVLAAAILADLDSPPFDKSMMDGYAVLSADCRADVALRIVEEVAAGAMPTTVVEPGTATRLFTGAPLPAGADAVVKQEDTTTTGDRVIIRKVPVRAGANVLLRGQEMRRGDEVLTAGTRLGPAALGVLAAVGRTSVPTIRRPVVSILATGSELVEADATPTGGQIRNTNGPMLAGQVVRAGGASRRLGIAGDTPDALTIAVRDALAGSDVLLLSGGVSVGKFDFVPDVLRDLGVTTHFHTVRMKPGKPLLFGTLGTTLVFGLPGNPVSSFVGFELFVRPALAKLAGLAEPMPSLSLPLAAELTANHDRPTYHPARVEGESIRPLAWFGSADLRGLLAANAFIVLPAGSVHWSAGQRVTAHVFEPAVC